MAKLFGIEIRRERTEMQDQLPSMVPPQQTMSDDGSMVVASGGAYGTYVDFEGTAKSEAELIVRYRDMAIQPEVDTAIDDIVNEGLVYSNDSDPLRINLDDTALSASVKAKVSDEFQHILHLLNFNKNGYEIFRQWYIDGRAYYHIVLDPKNLSAGIQELRYIDPRKLKKVKMQRKPKGQPASNTAPQPKVYDEYFIYAERGFTGTNILGPSPKPSDGPIQGLKIARDSIIFTTSGLTDKTGQMTLSYLHKAIKPLNQLKVLEDATVIYRISRAPERRIFYLDVGNLPKMKAEQYMKDMMTRHKNKLVYDAATGEVRDDRKYMTMLEDYWLPRREGNKGTEISTLPGGQNLGEMEDVNYFQKKLYRSLNVPVSRMEAETVFTLGRSAEISRDEVKFFKFIQKLRARFTLIFLQALEKQVVLKNIMTVEEWEDIVQQVKFIFNADNHFSELKDAEVLQARLDVADRIQPYIGKYYSNDFVRHKILKQTDEEIKAEDKLIQTEVETGKIQLGVPDAAGNITNNNAPPPIGA